MAVTKRELHRRIAAARGEVAAMLFFALPGPKEKISKRFSKDRYERDQKIKGLACVLDLLLGGEITSPEGNCGACGKMIRGGQNMFHTEDAGNFHATKRCWGITRGMTLHAAETQREQDADARKRLKQAREYLKARGMV